MKLSSIKWKEFEQLLYKVVTSVDDLINQFDNNIPRNSTEHQFYTLFINYLKSLKEKNDIHNVLKFITGGIQIPVVPQIKVKIIEFSFFFFKKEKEKKNANYLFYRLNSKIFKVIIYIQHLVYLRRTHALIS